MAAEPTEEIVNGIPVFHWEMPTQECAHTKAAAKWEIQYLVCKMDEAAIWHYKSFR